MNSTQFLETLQALNPVIGTSSDGGTFVEHFGNLNAELAAMESSAVVCPISQLRRIRISGNDRAKYLHNFCTNNIKELAQGHVCEAFFTDVKAKIIAHGLIAATDECHEIWTLTDDEQPLVNHLNRYIITEDVAIESDADEVSFFALMGPEATAMLKTSGIAEDSNAAAGTCSRSPATTVIHVAWNETPTVLLATHEPQELWNKLLAAGAVPSGQTIFEHQRIREGFPVVGVDVSSDNLAPEANRVAQAISYTKGCYLGQEPIARIDAMGHVNRKLFRCNAMRTADAESPSDLPKITSHSTATADRFPALIMLPVKQSQSDQPIHAVCSDGRVVDVELCK